MSSKYKVGDDVPADVGKLPPLERCRSLASSQRPQYTLRRKNSKRIVAGIMGGF